jgi:hypothetical protein
MLQNTRADFWTYLAKTLSPLRTLSPRVKLRRLITYFSLILFYSFYFNLFYRCLPVTGSLLLAETLIKS